MPAYALVLDLENFQERSKKVSRILAAIAIFSLASVVVLFFIVEPTMRAFAVASDRPSGF